MAREYEGLAQALASRGRYGDTMLMHVSPEEVNLLDNLAPGGITINPETGQSEAFIFSLLASILGPIMASIGTGLGGVLGALGTGLVGTLGSIGSFLGLGGGTAAATALPAVAASTAAGAAPLLGAGAGAIPMGLGAGGSSIAAGLPALAGVPGAVAVPTAIPGAIGGAASMAGGLGAGGASMVPSLATLGGGSIGAAAPGAAVVPGAIAGLPELGLSAASEIAGGALPELSFGVPGLSSAPSSGFGPGGASITEGAGALTLEPAPGWLEQGLEFISDVPMDKALLAAGLGAAMFPGGEGGEEEEAEDISDEELAARGAFGSFTPPGPPVGSDIVGFPTDEAFGTFVSDPSMMPGSAGVEDIGTLASATMAPPPSGIGGEQIAALGGGELYMDYVNSGSPLTFEEWIQMEGVVA